MMDMYVRMFHKGGLIALLLLVMAFVCREQIFGPYLASQRESTDTKQNRDSTASKVGDNDDEHSLVDADHHEKNSLQTQAPPGSTDKNTSSNDPESPPLMIPNMSSSSGNISATMNILNRTAWLNNNNRTMLSIKDISKARTIRAHLHVAPVNQKFLSATRLLHSQLDLNFDLNHSTCPRSKSRLSCYGLGTTVGRLNHMISRRGLLEDVDDFECQWFQNDKTKTCQTMFGDCYFPALTRGRYNGTDHTCHARRWFIKRYGKEAYIAAQFSWLLSDPVGVPHRPCLALHIRRGDACINPDRHCLDYDKYYRATEIIVRLYPEINHLVVVTDADDFPAQQFQELVPNISFSADQNRSIYNVQSLRNKSIGVWAPEFRNMGNATSELLNEVYQAKQCFGLVGTLTAGISRWILLHLIMRQGRIPVFWSLEGCLRNTFGLSDYEFRNCEELVDGL
jgi:hypothetical protein